MLATIQNIWKVTDLRNRILFTLGILLVYRIGSFIPVPNINVDALQAADQANQGMFGMLNIFSGGALYQFSIFAMGVMPYITASIIMQLLSMDVVPKFTQWAKEGEVGRRKIAQFTRYGTVVLGLFQAFSMAIGFNNLFPGLVKDANFGTYTVIAIVLTAGTAFLMWLGEQITERGIGNGISILIFAGIIAAIPSMISQIYLTLFANATDAALFLNTLKAILILVAVIAIIVGVIYVQQGVRKIPVQYAKRVVGRRMYGGQSTHIPLKVNAAGVIPVIFAMSLLLFPYTVASFFSDNAVARWIMNNTYYDTPLGGTLYVLLIIGFTFFYTFVQMNPQQMADNMKKNGGYIPGIRPGVATSKYLTKIISRITLTGALFLAAVSILPVIFGSLAGLPTTVTIGGTSLLIVVGVALETMKQIESQLIKRHYKGFINR